MSKRGGPGEQDGVEVEAKGEVKEGEYQHDMHGVTDPDDDAYEMGIRYTEVGVKVGQDIMTRCLSEEKISKSGSAQVDSATQKHRPLHYILHRFVGGVGSSGKLICNWMYCSKSPKKSKINEMHVVAII